MKVKGLFELNLFRCFDLSYNDGFCYTFAAGEDGNFGFEVLVLVCGSGVELVGRAARNDHWPSVMDARSIYQ